MKLEAGRIEAFLDDPGRARGVLLHGEDLGLIRARAARLVRAVAGRADDPFRVAEIDAAEAMLAEMASVPLSGGRRVVRLRDATDAAAKAVEAVLAGLGPGFLILEGSGLGPRSRLRMLAEQNPGLAAIACHPPDARGLAGVIRATLAAEGVRADHDASAWLADHLGPDHMTALADLGKLALCAGRGGMVDLDLARASVGDRAGASLDDALFAATSGEPAAADRALETALAEGSAPVAIARSAVMHLQRLQRVRLTVGARADGQAALRAARPPVFFRYQDRFIRSVRQWSPDMIGWAIRLWWDAERGCKRSGAPAEAICRDALARTTRRTLEAIGPDRTHRGG